MFEVFLKSFIPLFVAIDALGALPIFISLTRHVPPDDRKRLLNKSTLAALLIGSIFVFGGRAIFTFLGILESDFRVAGGLLLLIFAIRDLVVTTSHQGAPVPTRVGIVPIAIPLIMGPAALATVMVTSEQHGLIVTAASLVSNLVIAWLLFSRAGWILKRLGDDTSDAIAKIFSLLMAAIGVMLIRSGLMGMM